MDALRAAVQATPRDKYQKLDKIGEGSCGIVFRCRCRQTGRTVAIKKVRFSYEDAGGNQEHKDHGGDTFGASTQALREISLLQQLGNHPSVVQLLEVFTEPGLLYLVFPFLDRDLSRHLQEVGKLSRACVLRYSFQLLSALVHCHARCIAHRDVKPQNILVQLETDEVKLCDFSLSRRNLPVPRERQTQKVASLWYRSPEIFLGAETKGTCLDIWSAACVFAEMAKGEALFPGSSEIGMLFRQFEMLGTPSNKTWPGVTGLPHWSDEFPRFEQRSLQAELRLETSMANLLEHMLRCNPSHRLAASTLLSHPCFQYLDKTPSAAGEVARSTGLQDQTFANGEERDFTIESMMEDQRSPQKISSKVKCDSVDRRYPSQLFGAERGSHKRFKPTSTNQREADVPNPLSLLAEEWTRSTQPSSFRF